MFHFGPKENCGHKGQGYCCANIGAEKNTSWFVVVVVSVIAVAVVIAVVVVLTTLFAFTWGVPLVAEYISDLTSLLTEVVDPLLR